MLPIIPEAKRNVLDLMRRLRTMDDAEYLQSLIAYHGAPTLMGLKPATLVCPGASTRNLRQALDECGPRLARAFGVKVADFRNRAGSLLVLAYNPSLLRTALAAREVVELLRDSGYREPTASVEALLEQLRVKCAESEFPHEIGVFLGYPASDVRCFMRDGGRGCRAVGCWKAYDDIAEAKSRSARYTRAKMIAAELIVRGVDLGGMADGLKTAV